MLQVSDEEFKNIVAEAIDGVPPRYQKRLENVAFIVEDQPTEEQRQRLSLRPGDSLFGLYEGVPLPQRFGTTKLLPDKITLFKLPLLRYSRDLEELRDRVAKTVWHEVAHYFGLDHRRIHELE
jgi:predicted Zn-dependent protease with MMP-like domain